VLGEDYQFKTELQYDGQLKPDGTLDGNLYIRGGGDPTLGAGRTTGSLALGELMGLWVAKVKAAGIKRVNGMVVGDADVFDENVIPSGWTWSDIGNYYGSPAFGLNVNDNLYRLSFRPGARAGEPAKVLRTDPAMHGMEFTNEVTTGAPGSGDNAYIYGVPYTDMRIVQGTVPAGVKEFTIKGAMTDPPLTCAELFHDRLQAGGVPIDKLPTTTRLLRQRKALSTAGRTAFYTHLSPALKEIVYQTNLQSMNLYAEAMLKMMGVEAFKDGTTVSGTMAVENFWRGKGVDLGGFFMRDGSGLSRSNALTAATLTTMLQYAANQPFFTSYYASFPVAGVSGTMSNVGRGTAAEGNVRAKTGTIERVTSYSGYFRTRSGELMTFAIIANDYNGESKAIRRKIEKIMGMMVKLP
jgi:D-alanyl-D-alanine carboxypeptidase/D-alanyl-D-alanine-endopeptidase (penicillin-binding protein 4)